MQQPKQSIEVFNGVFGFAPKGCCPSEGAICDRGLRLIQDAGSWVSGTLTTWIGDEQKNHAWDLLCDAKRVYDQVWPTLMATNQTQAGLHEFTAKHAGWLHDFAASAGERRLSIRPDDKIFDAMP